MADSAHGHDPTTAVPGIDVPSERELLITAFHEAAHALVAVSTGVLVREMSVIPRPATAYSPGSLGHVLHVKPPLPHESDLWISSWWTEVQLQVDLAGYLIEDLLDFHGDGEVWPGPERRGPTGDHGRAVALLRTIAPRTPPEEVADHVRSIRRKTQALICLPGHLELLERMAYRLKEVGSLQAADLYREFFNGRCGALHPQDSRLRCELRPHQYGDHLCQIPSPGGPAWKMNHVPWAGFSLPAHRKVTSMTGEWKRVRTMLGGGPGPRIPKTWGVVFDACDDLPGL